MTRKRNTDHVVMRPKGVGCLHCGDEVACLPCSINVMTAVIRSFSKDHRDCVPGRYASPQAAAKIAPKTLAEWVRSWDVGVSSATLYRAFTGCSVPGMSEANDAPYDDADFGRCVRLLDIAPEWRDLLGEVARRVPPFAPLVPEWARLEELHRAGKAREAHREALRASLHASAAVLAELEADARALRSPVAPEPTVPAGRPDPARPAPCPGGGEHPHDFDLTMTLAHRAALRRVAEGVPLGDLASSDVLLPLCEAQLLGHDGEGWCLLDAGRAYLAAHDEARTRRTERPGPPAVPDGWRRVEGGPLPIRWWRYEGRLVDHVELCVDETSSDDALSERLEAAESTVALIRYLRAMRAARRREEADSDEPFPTSFEDGGAR